MTLLQSSVQSTCSKASSRGSIPSGALGNRQQAEAEATSTEERLTMASTL